MGAQVSYVPLKYVYALFELLYNFITLYAFHLVKRMHLKNLAGRHCIKTIMNRTKIGAHNYKL